MHDSCRQDCPVRGAVATNFTKDGVGWPWPGGQDRHDRIFMPVTERGFPQQAVFGPAGLGRETQIRPMASTSEPAQQQASPSPDVVTQDEATVASPAPLDPAAIGAEGWGPRGPTRTLEVISLLAWLRMV